MGSIFRMSALKIVSMLILFGVSNTKPNLGVYYESLCPTSRAWIMKEVWPSYKVLAEYFDVFFVAYGNANTTGSLEAGFSIECQHGEEECIGNVVQACTVEYVEDMWSQVYLLNCMSAASEPQTAAEACFGELGQDYIYLYAMAVKPCAESQEGQYLHFMNGEITNSLSPEQHGTPWPTWDGVGGGEVIQDTFTLGLVGYLCKHYYDDNLPDGVCQGELGRKMKIF